MTQRKMLYASHSQRMMTPFLWLCFSLLIFTACLGGGGDNNDPAANESVPLDTNQGTVVCNDACNNRGQCGERLDGVGRVVLINTSAPVLEGHDRFITEQTPVQILGSEMRTLQPLTGGDTSELPFYFVMTLDQTKGGWVAGWCVQP